jgi:hypothetical protein
LPIVGIGNGWSGRVTGGLSWTCFNGGTFSLGSEYGGLGASYKVWTASFSRRGGQLRRRRLRWCLRRFAHALDFSDAKCLRSALGHRAWRSSELSTMAAFALAQMCFSTLVALHIGFDRLKPYSK